MEYDLNSSYCLLNRIPIPDILNPEIDLYTLQVGHVPCGKVVQYSDLYAFISKPPCKMGTDEPGSTSNKGSFQSHTPRNPRMAPMLRRMIQMSNHKFRCLM